MKYITISFIACLIDLYSKHIINKSMKRKEKREIIPDKLYFINDKNEGIAYNKLKERPKLVKVITAAITAFFGVFFFKTAADKGVNLGVKIGSALVFGGALGNLIDRIKNGCVTDFIYVKAIKKSPIFNIADACIMVGVIFMGFFDLKK